MTEVLEEIKKALKKEYGKDFLEKIESTLEKEYGKDWKKNLLEKVEKETKENIRRQEEVCRNFHSEQIRLINGYKGEKFEISQEFLDASMRELRESFQFGEEMGMILFFKENNGKIVGDEFYDNEWIERKGIGHRTPFEMWVEKPDGQERKYPLGSFSFYYGELHKLMKERSKLTIAFHTHPYKAELSSGDLRVKPTCTGVIGFETVSEDLKKLTKSTYGVKKSYQTVIAKSEDFVKPEGCTEEEWNNFVKNIIGKKVMRRILFEMKEDEYGKILEECKPTVRIFYTEKDELIKLPVYVGDKLLT